jgi:hypothetical protein
MDYESLLKLIDAEIELLKKARALLAAVSTPKKTTFKIIAGAGSKKNISRSGLLTRAKKDTKESSTSFRITARKRGDGGSSGGGTGDGGYGIIR